MRLFAAIELNEPLRREFDRLELQLAGAPGVRWVAAENRHLTLRFFGEVDEGQGSRLRAALAAIPQPQPYDLPVVGLRFLLNPRAPRVFMALTESPKPLLDLQREIEEAARAIGLEAERRVFIPHITLGRLRDPRKASRLVDAVAGLSAGFTPIRLSPIGYDGFSLIESKLTPQGPIYRTIERYPAAAA